MTTPNHWRENRLGEKVTENTSSRTRTDRDLPVPRPLSHRASLRRHPGRAVCFGQQAANLRGIAPARG